MKKLLSFGLALFASVAAFGQTIASGTLTNGVNLVRDGGTQLLSMQLINLGSTVCTVTLFDNDSATSTNIIRPEYDMFTYAYSTNTSVFTNFFGQLQTNSYRYLSRSSSTVSAVTNAANQIAVVSIPGNSTVNILPSIALGANRGITALAETNSVSYVLNYLPQP